MEAGCKSPLQKSDGFKVVLIGNGYTGKSTWVERIIQGTGYYHNSRYTPTRGVNVTTIQLLSDDGNNIVTLKLWDCGGGGNYTGLREAYWIGADACIIFVLDIRDERTIKEWVRDVTRVENDIPIVICQSKSDLSKCRRSRYYTSKNIISGRGISSKTGHNVLDPIYLICKALVGDGVTETLTHIERLTVAI